MMKLWQQKNIMSLLLLPVTCLYRLVIAVRRFFYQQQIFQVTHCPATVIIVGNISVGGTGKTPLVAYLAQLLKKNGYQPGIITRGYRGKLTLFPHLVTMQDKGSDIGDEAKLLYQRSHCPVMIDPQRGRGVKRLISEKACNIILSDDGLQHYALARNMEIAVIDSYRMHGNGYCLPAGPLREPMSRLAEVDFIVYHGQAPDSDYQMSLQITKIVNLKTGQTLLTLDNFIGKTVHALAGIGNPQRFFRSLTSAGLHIIETAFPDHHDFSAKDIKFSDNLPVLMTEKDAVKCDEFADERHWVVEVAVVMDDKFIADFLRRCQTIIYRNK